jgi:hypothetical protein
VEETADKWASHEEVVSLTGGSQEAADFQLQNNPEKPFSA